MVVWEMIQSNETRFQDNVVREIAVYTTENFTVQIKT